MGAGIGLHYRPFLKGTLAHVRDDEPDRAALHAPSRLLYARPCTAKLVAATRAEAACKRPCPVLGSGAGALQVGSGPTSRCAST